MLDPSPNPNPDPNPNPNQALLLLVLNLQLENKPMQAHTYMHVYMLQHTSVTGVCVCGARAKPWPRLTSASPHAIYIYAMQDAVRRVSRKLGTMAVLPAAREPYP